MLARLPEKYSRFLLKHVGLRAVWPPTTALVPGDYGEFEDGVFVRLGNIGNDYNVACPVQPGASLDLDLTSTSTRVTQYHGGLKVKLITRRMSGDGALHIDFKKENSFFLRAKGCKSVALKSTVQVARQVARQASGWKHVRYWVLSEVYSAPSSILLASKKKDSTVKISGNVQALIKVFDGQLSGNLSVSGASNMSLSILGDRGPVLLRIFRVKVNGSPVVR
jgi:hypothetical protein